MINPKITPLGKNVILTPLIDKLPSGIHLPDSHKPVISRGTVYNIPKTVNSLMFGDEVVFDPEVAHAFKYENEDYIVVKEKDIIFKKTT